jgi:GTP-binding protein HflX
LRGPGETQLETDRRLIGMRVKRLKQDLKKFSKQRDNRRRSREKGDAYNVSLVGYTNSGKSTLFNVFTNARVHAANQLFATLDTTSRRVYLDKDQFMVLSDTVGFIKDLPHSLIESFKATLTETVKSNLLVHVIDYSDENWRQHYLDVLDVLKEVGANDIPRINLFNKIDLMGEEPRVVHDQYGRINNVWISASSKQGVNLVKKAIYSHKSFDKVSVYDDSSSCISEMSSLKNNFEITYPSSSSLI